MFLSTSRIKANKQKQTIVQNQQENEEDNILKDYVNC